MAVRCRLTGDAAKIQAGSRSRGPDALERADEDRLNETGRSGLQRAAQAVRVAGMDNRACQRWPGLPCLPQLERSEMPAGQSCRRASGYHRCGVL